MLLLLLLLLSSLLRDIDLNYFNDLNSNNFDSLYVLEENVKRYLCDIKEYDNLSLIHVNIRSMNSNFEKLCDLLLNCSNSFNIICVTETWSTYNEIKNNQNFHLPNFDFIHQERKTGKKGGSILIYVKNHIKFKIIKDLSVSDGDSECITVEIENWNSKKLIITCCYRPPSGAIKGLNSFLDNVFKKANTENKLCPVARDFNLNCLDYNKKLEIQTFYNQIFAHGCIPLITKPTRVTSITVSLIDNIFTNFIFNTSLKLKKEIIKSDVSDHFPVFVSLFSPSKAHKEYQKITIHKRVIHDTNLMAFNADLRNVNWNSINHSPEINSNYETFFKIFSELYEKHFPLKDFQIKVKDLQAPWMKKGLEKLSKQKQKFYIKFLRNKSTQNEQIYKQYKHLFEKLQRKAKQTYYQSTLKDCQNDMAHTWQIMKEIMGKCKVNSNIFCKSINVDGKPIKRIVALENLINSLQM